MRDQLKRLEEVQLFDAQIQELTTSLAAIPAKLLAAQGDLTKIETLLRTEQAQLAETQRYFSEQKELVGNDEAHVSGAKHKLSQAKNTKEYAAAQREIDTNRDSLSTRETEITKLVEAIAAKEKVLAERAADVKALRESIENDAEVARAGMADVQKKIDALKVGRDKVAQNVRADVLKRYGAIRMRRGLAMVAVANGTCRGCNMNIPPQLFNVLQRGTSLECCPYCHRIIYWEDLMKDPETLAAEAAAAAAPPAKAPSKAAKALAASRR